MFWMAVSPQSFSTPSWQIEAKYSTRVLTGNWVEERKKVRRQRGWAEDSEEADGQRQSQVHYCF